MIRNSSFLAKKQDFIGISTNNQRGSAIIWIFIMVALFAALGYALSQGSRGGAAGLSEKQAELAATEILNYARQVKEAVHALQINGCSDTEISFENARVAGHSNPSAPPDKSCHILHPNGGGVSFMKFSEKYFNFNRPNPDDFDTWPNLDGYNSYPNIGEELKSDLSITFVALNQNICTKINNLLGVNNPGGVPPTDTTDMSAGGYTVNGDFKGVYLDSASLVVGDAGTSTTALQGKMAACVHETIGCNYSDCYNFYQVLIAR